jgi:quercetin dioxygenase-like cupin family protein
MGARLVFRKTADETNGELLQFDFFLKPRGEIAEQHLHPRQEERFEVVSGRMRGIVSKKPQTAETGDVVVVPPGTRHAWWNDGDEEAHLVVEFRPALRAEEFFETAFGLARDGKTDERGLPNIWQRAVLLREYDDEFFPASGPLPIIKVMMPILARIGRLRGYRPHYPEYSSPNESAARSDAGRERLP